MNASDLIDKLGGHRALAEKLGVADWKSVHNWRRAGRTIPHEFWPDIVRLAAESGDPDLIGVDLDTLFAWWAPHRGARAPVIQDAAA